MIPRDGAPVLTIRLPRYDSDHAASERSWTKISAVSCDPNEQGGFGDELDDSLHVELAEQRNRGLHFCAQCASMTAIIRSAVFV